MARARSASDGLPAWKGAAAPSQTGSRTRATQGLACTRVFVPVTLARSRYSSAPRTPIVRAFCSWISWL